MLLDIDGSQLDCPWTWFSPLHLFPKVCHGQHLEASTDFQKLATSHQGHLLWSFTAVASTGTAPISCHLTAGTLLPHLGSHTVFLWPYTPLGPSHQLPDEPCGLPPLSPRLMAGGHVFSTHHLMAVSATVILVVTSQFSTTFSGPKWPPQHLAPHTRPWAPVFSSPIPGSQHLRKLQQDDTHLAT